jgi:hypothetical protein
MYTSEKFPRTNALNRRKNGSKTKTVPILSITVETN